MPRAVAGDRLAEVDVHERARLRAVHLHDRRGAGRAGLHELRLVDPRHTLAELLANSRTQTVEPDLHQAKARVLGPEFSLPAFEERGVLALEARRVQAPVCLGDLAILG